jgi:hypothetical protein
MLHTSLSAKKSSGYSAPIRVTVSRQSRDVSSTFALSTLQTFLLRLRRLERDMRDANDLRLAVAHGVEALALAREGAVWRLAEASRLAEIDVAVELAYDQDVKPAHFLRLQWGRTDELVIQDRRAQIRE